MLFYNCLFFCFLFGFWKRLVFLQKNTLVRKHYLFRCSEIYLKLLIQLTKQTKLLLIWDSIVLNLILLGKSRVFSFLVSFVPSRLGCRLFVLFFLKEEVVLGRFSKGFKVSFLKRGLKSRYFSWMTYLCHLNWRYSFRIVILTRTFINSFYLF